MNTNDINGYVDQKNSLMLAVLGLHETLKLFRPRMNQDFWIEFNSLGEAQFCFYDGIDIYRWSIVRMLEHDIVLDILGWGNGVLDYVD